MLKLGWEIGYDTRWQRDIGYGVPAYCDHPQCWAKIDRGLAYVCGGEPYGGERGCGLYFCGFHRHYVYRFGEGVELCSRCRSYRQPYPKKGDHPKWTHHKRTDPSWAEWRAANP